MRKKSLSSRDMNSICSSGSGGSGFTGSPILCHSSLRPLWVATDGTAGGLVKPRTLMGAAVGRREAWLGLLPTPTSSYIPAAPVAFLPPRLTHDKETRAADPSERSRARGWSAHRQSLHCTESSARRPPNRSVCFFLSVC